MENGWILADDEGSSSTSSEDTTKVEVVPVDSATVSGFAQKGPFVDGSTVTINGIDSLFGTTKEKFSGKVSGDSGAYGVSGVSLQNQYALVTVNGFFLNGVSGKKTTGSKIKLSALADLTDTSSAGNAKVHVNLFSHLEYARVVNLVTDEKYNIPAAKRRATKELLAQFGRGYSGAVSAESSLVATAVSLQDTGYVGASLYAAGIMMVADLNPAKISSRMASVSKDFAEDGLFNDSTVRAQTADWLSSADSADNYASIRKNVQAWKLASPVPDFESILRAFWTSEFGLPECTDSLETHIEKNKNKNSASHDEGFVCTSLRWHRVSALDVALGLCTADKEGSFAKLDSAKEYYTCATGVWQEISETAYNLKECTAAREGEYTSEGGEFFACVARQWREIDSVSYELKMCTLDRFGEYAKTKNGFYRCINSSWEEISEVEYTLKTCSSENAGEKATIGDDRYLCLDGSWMPIDAATYELGLCDASKEGALDETEDFDRYVCEISGDSWAWRKLTETEAELGLCTADKEGSAKESSIDGFVACKNGKWIETDETSALLGDLCQEALENEVRWNGASFSYDDEDGILEDPTQPYYFDKNVFPAKEANFYECHNGKWESSTGIRWLYGANCAEGSMNSYYSADYDARIGLHFNFSDSSAAEILGYSIFKASTLSSFGFDLVINANGDTLHYAICKNKDWEKISEEDYEQQEVCSANTLGQQINEYKCTADGWVATSVENLGLGNCNYDGLSSTELYSGYVCDTTTDGSYYWRTATTAEEAVGWTCSVKMRTDNGTLPKHGYVCDSSGYRLPTTLEKRFGKACTNRGGSLSEIIDSDTIYHCPGQSSGMLGSYQGKGWLKFATGDVFYEGNGEAFDVTLVGSTLWMNKNVTDGTTCYNDKETNCLTDGALFDGGYKKFCPSGGWTSPDSTRFAALLNSGKTFPIQYSGYCKINSFDTRGNIKDYACYKRGKHATLWLNGLNNVQYEGKSWTYDYSDEYDYRYKPLRCVLKL